ncbi:DUF6894 family protein [uncultured Sphingomonas sp.]|uniref:DUF6894 family protein n=1 Tax=uncultured Sphingomonas sp. TaxID=158754 RepID=UPI0035CA59FD
MPLFYLHIHYCDGLARDEEGLELPSLDAARDEAIAGARAMMCEELKQGRVRLGCHIDIEDGDERLLAVVPFREAVTFTGLEQAKSDTGIGNQR